MSDAPKTTADQRAARNARIESKKPDARLLIVDGKVFLCDVAALSGGACP